MNKINFKELTIEEMTSNAGGNIWGIFGPIGLAYTIGSIIDDFQKGWHSVDNQTKYH